MNIRLYNARILTMEPGREVFYGEIWVKNDKIAYVAEQKELAEEWDKTQFPRIAWDIELDCKGNLLMPGFKNAHTHTAMTFLRSYADDVPLQTWLYEKIFPMEDKLTKEDQYWLIRLGIMEYLTSGITANFDMYRDFDCHAEVSCDVGFRT
ncbi:MAG: amidohydrolase family protein, partial [Lachnospiraceae bacterium]|nr:amidohydrolase family protein [Lachnospiraceae bacterium]